MAEPETYHDREGWIWFDGKLVPWRDASVHVLTDRADKIIEHLTLPCHLGSDQHQVYLAVLPRSACLAKKSAIFLVDVVHDLLAEEMQLRLEHLFAAGDFGDFRDQLPCPLVLEDRSVDHVHTHERPESRV